VTSLMLRTLPEGAPGGQVGFPWAWAALLLVAVALTMGVRADLRWKGRESDWRREVASLYGGAELLMDLLRTSILGTTLSSPSDRADLRARCDTLAAEARRLGASAPAARWRDRLALLGDRASELGLAVATTQPGPTPTAPATDDALLRTLVACDASVVELRGAVL
jgi:hypothetical protein